VSLKA
jgi:hypothetical protein